MRALDGRDVEPEYSVRQAVAGDRYLICSDGLSGVVSRRDDRGDRREYCRPARSAPSGWSQLALRGGGPDNITVIVADVTDADIVEDAPVVGGAAASDRVWPASADASTPAARALGPERAARPGADADGAADEPERPRRPRSRTAPYPAAGRWPAARRRAVGRLAVHPVAVLRRRHRRRQVAVFRGIPGAIAGFDLSTVQDISADAARRPDPGRAGSGAGGHPGRQPGRGASRSSRR